MVTKKKSNIRFDGRFINCSTMAICTGKIGNKSEEGLEDEVVGIHLGKFREVVIQDNTGVSAPGFPS